MLKAILFDMDGTLIDTEQILFHFHAKKAKKLGLTFTKEFYASLMGQDPQLIREMCREEFRGRYPWKEAAAEAYQVVTALASEGKLPLRPGMRESLPRLKEMGLRLGLVTSTERSIVEGYISHLPAMQNLFDAKVCGMEALKSKPAPEPFLMCAEKLGVLPQECMGVEDGAAGLQSITAAGMTSVFIPDILQESESLRPYISYLLHNLSDLPQLVSILNAL